MPVLFFYITPQSALRIRELLGMQDPIGPYFDPAGKGMYCRSRKHQEVEKCSRIRFIILDQTHRRITLLPDKIPDESKVILKEMYKDKSEELNAKEANDILVQASPKTASLTISMTFSLIFTIFIVTRYSIFQKSTQQFIAARDSVKKPTSTTSCNSTSSNGVIQT